MRKLLLFLSVSVLLFVFVGCDSETLNKVAETMESLGHNIYSETIKPDTSAADNAASIVTAVKRDENGTPTSIEMSKEECKSFFDTIDEAMTSPQTTMRLRNTFRTPVDISIANLMNTSVGTVNAKMSTFNTGAVNLDIPAFPIIADLAAFQLLNNVVNERIGYRDRSNNVTVEIKKESLKTVQETVRALNNVSSSGQLGFKIERVIFGSGLSLVTLDVENSTKAIETEVPELQPYVDMLGDAVYEVIKTLKVTNGTIDSDSYKSLVLAMTAKRVAFEYGCHIVNPIEDDDTISDFFADAIAAKPGEYDLASAIDYILSLWFSEADRITSTVNGAESSFLDVLQAFVDDNGVEKKENPDVSSLDAIVDWFEVESNWESYTTAHLVEAFNTIGVMAGDCNIEMFTNALTDFVADLPL